MNSYLHGIGTGRIDISDNLPDGIKIIITGDFCLDNGIEDLCLNNQFEELYGNVLPILREKDLSITNLECPLTEKVNPIEKTGRKFIANPKCIDAIKYGAFDVVTLANNHILDQNENGLKDTIRLCKENGIKTVGAGENLAAAMQPLYLRIKNRTIAILNFAEHEFSIATKNTAGAAPLDPIKNYYEIAEARKKSDIVIVIIHGGNEYYPLPSPRVMEIYRFFAHLGASAVIGHHTHCSSGFETFRGVPIFYSLGNFIFDRHKQNKSWYEGYLVRMTVVENRVGRIVLIPYFQCKHDAGLELMDERESGEFLKEIERYSGVIQDTALLNNQWQAFCKSQELNYLAALKCLGRVRKFMVKKRILPRPRIKKKDLTALLNLFRCQAHREVTVEVLRGESEGRSERIAVDS